MTGKIEIDASPWMDEKGIEVCVYIGEGSCEPCVEDFYTYEDLVTKHIEAHCIRDKMPERSRKCVEEFVRKLEDVAEFARKKMLEKL